MSTIREELDDFMESIKYAVAGHPMEEEITVFSKLAFLAGVATMGSLIARSVALDQLLQELHELRVNVEGEASDQPRKPIDPPAS